MQTSFWFRFKTRKYILSINSFGLLRELRVFAVKNILGGWRRSLNRFALKNRLKFRRLISLYHMIAASSANPGSRLHKSHGTELFGLERPFPLIMSLMENHKG